MIHGTADQIPNEPMLCCNRWTADFKPNLLEASTRMKLALGVSRVTLAYYGVSLPWNPSMEMANYGVQPSW